MRINIKHETKLISFNPNQDIKVSDLIKALKNHEQLNINNDEIILLDENQNILDQEELIKINPNCNKSANDKNLFSNSFNNIFDFQSTKNEEPFENERNLFLQTYSKMFNQNKKYKSFDEFFEIKSNNLNDSKKKINEITDLIQKTTNAKEKMNTLEINKPINRSSDRFRIFEDLLTNNLGGLIGQRSGPLASQANQINELLNILRPMIENDVHAEPTDINARVPNANTGSSIFRPIRINNHPVVPDENLLNNLKEMGFPEEQCRRALIHARNDISRATDLLLSDGLDYLPNEPNNNNNNNLK
jgi:hypothetical protein